MFTAASSVRSSCVYTRMGPLMSKPIGESDFLSALQSVVYEVLRSEERVPVRINPDPAACVQEFNLALPVQGIGLDELASRLTRLLLASPTTSTPRFFNQLFGGRDWSSLLGDMLVPLVNNSMYTYKVAGPHVLIEDVLIQKMGRLMGYDKPGGIFSPGGSLSNLTAIVMARNVAEENVRDDGMAGRRHRIYSSAVSHYSIRKGANMAGLGRDNVVKIAVDAQARMLPEALDEAIRRDLEKGFVPTMVNATLGTTVEGAFDPIPPIADVCERHGVWLHLDGAWGASLILCPETKHLFEGSERADSITWDAHKMMGVPLTSSVLLTRESRALSDHFNEQADYLFQEDSERLNPGTRSIQCGRRNDVLKVWSGWQYHGDIGHAERLRTCRRLVNYAVDVIASNPRLELAIEPESLNVCFRVLDACSKEICAKLHAEGRIMVGYGDVHGETIVRVVFLNPALTEHDLDVFFAQVCEVAG